MKIAIVAPSCPLKPEAAEAALAIAAARGDAELLIHPQCFLSDGHFAGSDEVRLDALQEVMTDEDIDAIWFARGGYGSNRIAEAAARDLPEAAHDKTYLGYSDSGFLLAGFHKAGLNVAHGPLVQDVLRDGGSEAIHRALDWLTRRDPAALEPSFTPGQPTMAFNLTVLNNLLGTALEPDFTGVELVIEEVAEHEYHIDRMMFHLTRSPAIRAISGLRLGCVTDTPDNDRPFGSDVESIVRDWCGRSEIAYLGRAEIGHVSTNRIVPFGSARN